MFTVRIHLGTLKHAERHSVAAVEYFKSLATIRWITFFNSSVFFRFDVGPEILPLLMNEHSKRRD